MTRALVGAAIAGAIGLALFVVGIFVDRRQAMHSYLAAFAYVASIPIGALILIAIGHLMGSRWFVVVRRLPEAIVVVFPLLALLFVPIALGIPDLYPWAGAPAPEAHDPHYQHLLHHKRAYLNVPFFIGRTAFYFAVWTALSFAFRRWSWRQDAEGAATPGRPVAVSALALPALAFTLTFAAFDWMMSLAPAWFSAAFGLYYFAGGFMAAVGVVLLAASLGRAAMQDKVGPSHFHALGRLLFAFVIVWAYIAYAQGFIIWIANKPEEVPWYIARVRGSWGVLGVVLIVGHFAVPFLVLLSKDLKKRPRAIAIMAAWLLVMHYIDIHWLVLPVLHPGFSFHWLDAAALVGIGGVSTAFALWRIRGRSLLAKGDPRFEAGVRYESP